MTQRSESERAATFVNYMLTALVQGPNVYVDVVEDAAPPDLRSLAGVDPDLIAWVEAEQASAGNIDARQIVNTLGTLRPIKTWRSLFTRKKYVLVAVANSGHPERPIGFIGHLSIASTGAPGTRRVRISVYGR